MKIKIRKARLKDLKEIVKIAKETIEFHSQYDKELYSNRALKFYPTELKKSIKKALFFVALADKKIVGYVYGSIHNWYPGYKIGNIVDLAVKENYRGKGIGKSLLKTIISTLKKKGCKKAVIQVELKNKIALFLYHSLGFKYWKYRLIKSL